MSQVAYVHDLNIASGAAAQTSGSRMLRTQGLHGRCTRKNRHRTVGSDKGRQRGQECPSGSGSQTKIILGHYTPSLVAAIIPGLIVTLGDLTWLTTLIPAHSISWATSLSLHPLTGVRPNPQILPCFLTFSTSLIHLACVMVSSLWPCPVMELGPLFFTVEHNPLLSLLVLSL